jgi:glycosyltransferase involved in cell wall biosynthesis
VRGRYRIELVRYPSERAARVAIVSNYFPAYRAALFRSLEGQGDIEFVYISGKATSASFIPDAQLDDLHHRSIRVLRVGVPGTKNAFTWRCGTVSAMFARKYDALVLPNDILAPDVWLACLLSRMMRVPVCIWGQGLSRPPGRFRDALRKALTRLATAAVYYTESGRDYWAARGIDTRKLFVAYNALDTVRQVAVRDQMDPAALESFLRDQGLAGRKLFTFLGRLIEEKRPRFFIDAIATAVAVDTSVVGLLIGDGPERAALEELVRARGLAEHIRFVGAIHEETTIAAYLIPSTAVVLPAFAGLAIQHAGIYGVPLVLGDVAHSHGPEREIVVDQVTGIWCGESDLGAFARAMLRLTSEPGLRETLSANIRHVVESKYSVGAMAQGILDATRYCLVT